MKAGERAESLACRWLQTRGLQLLERNYRCRAGELDLVMKERDELIVAEVRYRRGSSFGHAEETVDARKQRRIINATRHYLATHPTLDYSAVRFDVVALSAGLADPAVRWIRDAFASD